MIVDGMRRNNQFFWDVFAETNRPEKLPMLGHIWDTLQDFPGNDTHNLTQEWLSGRACGTIKILVRQATGQTYTGLRTGEEAVAVYRAAFAHLKEQGFQWWFSSMRSKILPTTGTGIRTRNRSGCGSWLPIARTFMCSSAPPARMWIRCWQNIPPSMIVCGWTKARPLRERNLAFGRKGGRAV